MKLIQIKNSSDIDLLGKLITKKNIFGIDTEFIRENTYFPILSLVQIAVDDVVFIYDFLKNKNYRTNLAKILSLDKSIKIFHDCEQDIEILEKNFDIEIKNIFDTQLANAFIDLEHHISYKNLVKNILDLDIDKKHQNSNWLKRPLSKHQLFYAASDVIHLEKLYKKISRELSRQKKSNWFDEEMKNIIQTIKHKSKPENSWEKIRISDKNKINLELIKSISSHRESISRSKNIPKSWYLKDKQIIKISSDYFRNLSLLKKLNLTENKYFFESDIDEIYKICNKHKKGYYNSSVRKINVKKAQINIKNISKKIKVSETLIANKKDLENFFLDKERNNPSGWRKHIYESINEQTNE